MQDRFFTAIREGMEVYDRDDDKVGKVGKLYRPASAVASTGTAPGSYTEPSKGGEPYFKVDAGFLGLGKDLYIPASAIAGVNGDRVTLNVDKDVLDDRGWDRRPDWIAD
jgi:hypothetical protein